MQILLNKTLSYRFIRFAIVGVLNTVLDLAILNLLVHFFHVTTPVVFSVCKGVSFLVAVTNSYFMNKHFAFNQKESKEGEFSKFFVLSIVGLGINISVASFVFYVLGQHSSILPPYLITSLSGIMGGMASFILNYFNYAYFVFK
jgi:putative flippase GtrA